MRKLNQGIVQIIPVIGLPEFKEGDDIASSINNALRKSRISLLNRDIIVIKQKIISKSEGRLVRLKSIRPSREAKRIGLEQGKDPRIVELILRESKRIVRIGHGVIITETKHGFVCANAGIDQSNVRKGYVALLPEDPDRSARSIRIKLESLSGKSIAVIITDTFGRPWRKGQTDVAIGCSGIEPLISYKGKKDRYGYKLRVTQPAIVDEIAGAAELVMGKLSHIPVAIVRGVRYRRGEDGVRSIIMEKERDLFR